MCGISGILTFSRDTAQEAHSLLAVHRGLRHRGPDGEAFLSLDQVLQPRFFSGPLAPPTASLHSLRALIGFHWLKIQDLHDESRQPMASPDSRVWLAFNGEIY